MTHPQQPTREVLEQALERMDRARDILTNGNPRPECNWGLLDTAELRQALAQPPEPAPSTAGEREVSLVEAFDNARKSVTPEMLESFDALLQSTALPDHSEQHLDMVAALPVGELTLPSKRDIGEFDPKKSGSTFFRGLGWNEAIDEVAGLLAAARAQPVLEPLTPEESVAHAIGLTGGRQ